MTSEKIISKVSESERKIIALKYQSKQIQTMAPEELRKESKTLLLKIHVITGWTIPDKELTLILVDQFEKKLVESYGDLNHDEIEYAFRSKGTTIEDWGKSMNLNLLDKVLLPYLDNRFELSRIEEKETANPTQASYSTEELMNFHRAETESCYQRFRIGNTNYFPTQLMTQILVSDGLIAEGSDVKEFFTAMVKKGAENIYKKDS